VAIKAALQYNYNKGIKKTKIIAFEDAFHGDTFGAMASSGITFFTEAFHGSLLEVVRIPVPTSGNESASLFAFEKLVTTNEFAAFIFEPLCQGAA
jgi:adenosylmethionine-8-amino-7-oxononanoate aminotransferase